jgi:branched-chain amino acid transport system permease protein
LWAFAIGAAIGGLGGVMYSSKVIAITPDNFTLIVSILILSAVVLGGSGNMLGVVVGAALIAYLPERFRGFAEYRVMIFRPEGLLPSRQRAVELREAEPEGGLGTLGGVTGLELDHVPTDAEG